MFLCIHAISFLIVFFALVLLTLSEHVVTDELRSMTIGASDYSSGVTSTMGDDCYKTEYKAHGPLAYIVVMICYYWSNELWNCMKYFVVAFTTGVWYYKPAPGTGDGSFVKNPVRLENPPCAPNLSLRLLAPLRSLCPCDTWPRA